MFDFKKKEKIKCQYCNQGFESENALNSHVGKAHLKDVTKPFKPNKKQLALIEAWADPEQKPTITAICEKIDIDRQTYYRWFKDDRFVAWFNKAWKKAMKDLEPYLDNIGVKMATKDYRYWEGMQMKYGKFRKKIDKKVTGKSQIFATGSKVVIE